MSPSAAVLASIANKPKAAAVGFVRAVAFFGGSNTTTSTQAVTTTGLATVGSTVIVSVRARSAVTITSVTDSAGNTWVRDIPGSTGTIHLAVFRSKITTQIPVGGTITAHFSTHPAVCFITALLYAGFLTTPVDITATIGGSGTSHTISATTTHAPDLIYTVGTISNNHAMTVATGYTQRSTHQGSSTIAVADKIVTTTGSKTAAWSWVTSLFYVVTIIGYKVT
jgi:hypothetical protein